MSGFFFLKETLICIRIQLNAHKKSHFVINVMTYSSYLILIIYSPGGVVVCCPGYVWIRQQNRCINSKLFN